MTVFADTYYYLAMLNPADAGHARAMSLSRASGPTVVTTPWVLTEVADGLSRPPLRNVVVQFLQSTRADVATEIVPASDDLFERGLQRFMSRLDKAWSLTDCISFVVMEDRGITEALTADHHFEQAGFVALLK